MIITFASSKGGVGKSTACACVAAELVRQGSRVLILDLDQNRTVYRWSRRAPFPGLSVEAVKPQEFSKVIRRHRASGQFDHIAIDLPGTREVTLYKALALADIVVVPAQASEPDLHETLTIVSDVKDVGETTNREIPYRLLLTKLFPLPTRVTGYAYAELKRHRLPVFETALVERVAYRELFLTGMPPTAQGREKGAGREVHKLTEEIKRIAQKSAAPIQEFAS